MSGVSVCEIDCSGVGVGVGAWVVSRCERLSVSEWVSE